jgi:hypothetical protein
MVITASQFSQLFLDHAALMMLGMGIYMTYITGTLNVYTVSGMEFPCFFIEPCVYSVFLILDISHVVSFNTVAMIYVVLLTIIVVKYIMFMRSIIV